MNSESFRFIVFVICSDLLYYIARGSRSASFFEVVRARISHCP